MVALLWLSACREPVVEPTSATSVRFEPGLAPLDWGAVPWPSDLYRDEAGRITLGALPGETALADPIRSLLALGDGSCTTCALAFQLDGALDRSSVPVAVDQLTDPVVLVDLATGEPVPLQVQWADGRLTVRPQPGHVLRPRERYAVAVTDAILGDDGLPLSAAPAFDRVRHGRAGADPRALAVLGPAFDLLDPRRVVGLGVFTTGDPTDHALAVREAVRSRPPGPPAVDAVWTGSALDELLGVPGEDWPGIDVPPLAGTEGTRAIAHDTTLVVVSGTFPAARFVEGSGDEVGALTRDEAGLPAAASDDRVPFVLIVPEGADVTRLPVVIAHHGFNASRTIGFALADTVGRAGFAVLAVDAYQHGARAPSAVDTVHAMRGDVQGPDGFSETVQLDVSGRVFGMFGVPSEQVLSPAYPLAAFTQFAADALSAVALVRSGDWTAVAAADPALAGLSFDPERVAFVGNSMGAVVGASVLAAEPDLGAGVLNVLPGSIVDTLTESGEFKVLVDGVLLPIIGVDGAFDEVERSLALDPLVDLYRQVLEPVDPLALASAWGSGPDVLVQLAGHDEVAAPGPAEAAVLAAGLEGVGTFALAPVPPASLPASSAAVRFDGAMHGMLEVRWQTSVWDEPLVPPLSLRSEPLTVENPIREIHAQLEAFLGAYHDRGRGSIAE